MKTKKQINRNYLLAAIGALSLAKAFHANAAERIVTFNVPIDVKKLDPGVHGVGARCEVFPLPSRAGSVTGYSKAVKVTNGEFNGTVPVTVKIPDEKIPGHNSYSCSIYVDYTEAKGPGAIGRRLELGPAGEPFKVKSGTIYVESTNSLVWKKEIK